MKKRRDSVVPWACVFKLTLPNGKIYVGSDTANTAQQDFFKYFGSPLKAKTDMLSDLGEYLAGAKAYWLKKEILHCQRDITVREILKIEQHFILTLKARDPDIGYNR